MGAAWDCHFRTISPRTVGHEGLYGKQQERRGHKRQLSISSVQQGAENMMACRTSKHGWCVAMAACRLLPAGPEEAERMEDEEGDSEDWAH